MGVDIAVDPSTPHPIRTRMRGFLFADLRGYTDFVETRGDHAAADLLAAYRRLVREAVAGFEGAEVKTEGDSFYVVFESASDAVGCALSIVNRAAQASAADPSLPIRVGVGIHAGETVETDEGFVGSAVNVAARVCSVAGPGQVLVTETVRSLTRTFLEVGFVPLGSRPLKGVAEAIPLYRIDAVPAREWALGRRARRPSRLLVAGSAVVLAIVVLAAGLMAWNRVGAPSASPSAPPSSSPTSSPSEPVTSGGWGAADLALLAHVPLRVRDGADCVPTPAGERLFGAVGGVRCDLLPGRPAERVWYDAIADPTFLRDAWTSLAQSHGATQGDCSTEATAIDDWSLPGFLSGHRVCYQEGGTSWLVWTYNEPQPAIIVRAHREDSNWRALIDWWDIVGPALVG